MARCLISVDIVFYFLLYLDVPFKNTLTFEAVYGLNKSHLLGIFPR